MMSQNKRNSSELDLQGYEKDWSRLEGFIESTYQNSKPFCVYPTLMIFDDHDVTDDWNLSADLGVSHLWPQHDETHD